MTKTQHIVSLICNAAAFILVLYAFVTMFCLPDDIFLAFSGWLSLKLFTVDSNLLAGLSCAVMIPFNIRGIRNGGGEIPHAALVFKLVGTATVTLTFLTVVCFLGPIAGYASMFGGANLYFHLICPLLCIASFTAVERGPISIPESLIPLIPVALYGALYLTMVVAIGEANGGWNDWYGFNRGGMWPVTIAIMGVVTALIGLGLRLPHRPHPAG